jgi:hypothetical protein
MTDRTEGRGMIDMERMMRQDHWVEGAWVVLADGNRWCFPPPESVPGYDDLVSKLVHGFIADTMPLLNTDAVHGHLRRWFEGSPEGAIRTLSRVFSIYRLAFAAGSILLVRNYSLGMDALEALMPFNFDADGTPEMKAKIDRFGPDTALMCNAVAALCGADINGAMARIAQSN